MKKSDRSDAAVYTPEQNHARENFCQILFPLILVCVLLTVSFVLLLVYAGEIGSSTEGLAAAALVVIALPAFLVLLVFLLVFVALIIGTAKVTAWLPGAGKQVQTVFSSVSSAVHKGSREVLNPLLAIGQKSAEFGYVLAELRHRLLKGKVR
ncbi:MAG: hypothetical protein LC103_08840 [Anaerolineales bacterium]|jgi:lysylphosphatidylglycerol synthetase-like protein (DUF2156 family)|nr:hypothetical protein [Anaerolineales bacterium]